MPYEVHFEHLGGPTSKSDVFDRFYDAQLFAMQRQRELRADLVAIREIAEVSARPQDLTLGAVSETGLSSDHR